MSASAHLVHKNFVWRIESISPTSKLVARKFTSIDRPLTPFADQSSGTTRDFAVYSESAGPVYEPTDGTGHTREWLWSVDVAYTTDMRLSDLHEAVLQDSYDLITTLRDDAKWLGYSSAATTTDIGLWNRHLVEQRLDRSSPTTWYLRHVYATEIYEAE